jgi:hypothetical protein
MSNNALTVNENHAQQIIQTMYDDEAGAGYVKFCDCPNGGTTDRMMETKHGLIYDWDEKKTHVSGMEITFFPKEGLREGPLGADLTVTELSEAQKEAVLSRFLKG